MIWNKCERAPRNSMGCSDQSIGIIQNIAFITLSAKIN